jgi:hypothetical protein
MDREQTRLAFHHNRASFLQARANQCNPQRIVRIPYSPLDPFSAGARLARAAAAENEPQPPIVMAGLELFVSSPRDKVMKDAELELAFDRLLHLRQSFFLEQLPQVV